MTLGELIKELQKLPEDLIVVGADNEYGCTTVLNITIDNGDLDEYGEFTYNDFNKISNFLKAEPVTNQENVGVITFGMF